MATLAENKRARFDYEVLETFDAGIVLKGFEVKAVKNGRIQIAGAYVTKHAGGFWLTNAVVSPYQVKNTPAGYDAKRSRRLLLTKKEIKHLIGKLNEKGLTLLPFKVYTMGRRNLIKVQIGLAKPKKKFDKREAIKKRETEREIRETGSIGFDKDGAP